MQGKKNKNQEVQISTSDASITNTHTGVHLPCRILSSQPEGAGGTMGHAPLRPVVRQNGGWGRGCAVA